MNPTEMLAAPVTPGAPTPGGGRCNQPVSDNRLETTMLQLSLAIEHIEYARVIVERHVRSAPDADRVRLIEVSECLTAALTRLRGHEVIYATRKSPNRIEALENIEREVW